MCIDSRRIYIYIFRKIQHTPVDNRSTWVDQLDKLQHCSHGMISSSSLGSDHVSSFCATPVSCSAGRIAVASSLSTPAIKEESFFCLIIALTCLMSY